MHYIVQPCIKEKLELLLNCLMSFLSYSDLLNSNIVAVSFQYEIPEVIIFLTLIVRIHSSDIFDIILYCSKANGGF